MLQATEELLKSKNPLSDNELNSIVDHSIDPYKIRKSLSTGEYMSIGNAPFLINCTLNQQTSTSYDPKTKKAYSVSTHKINNELTADFINIPGHFYTNIFDNEGNEKIVDSLALGNQTNSLCLYHTIESIITAQFIARKNPNLTARDIIDLIRRAVQNDKTNIKTQYNHNEKLIRQVICAMSSIFDVLSFRSEELKQEDKDKLKNLLLQLSNKLKTLSPLLNSVRRQLELERRNQTIQSGLIQESNINTKNTTKPPVINNKKEDVLFEFSYLISNVGKKEVNEKVIDYYLNNVDILKDFFSQEQFNYLLDNNDLPKRDKEKITEKIVERIIELTDNNKKKEKQINLDIETQTTDSDITERYNYLSSQHNNKTTRLGCRDDALFFIKTKKANEDLGKRIDERTSQTYVL